MQVSIQTTSGLERRLTVGVPAARVDNEVKNRLEKAGKSVRLPGFRPGKVPFKVLKQRFGEGIRQEVLGEVMGQTFQEAIVQEKLRPAGQPSIEAKSLTEGKDIEYIATFEVFPDIEEADYSALAISKPVAEITDADVDKMVDTLRQQQATWQAVDRAAQDGDQVNINYVGTKDSEKFEGGSAQDSNLVLGSNRMIPGFEAGIVGMKAGQEKTLSLSFPDDYHAEALKGAAVEFAITLNSVSAQQLPEMDDAFFANFGVTEGGVDAFRAEVLKNMQRELDNAIKAKIKNQVMDFLVETHKSMQTPKALIKDEIKLLRSQMMQQFGGAAQSLDVESLLPDDMFHDRAETRVRLGLVLNEYVQQQQIKPDAEKVKETIERLASTYEDPQEVINFYYSNQQQLQEIQALVIEDAVVEKLVATGTVTEKPCSYEEAVTPETSEEA